MKRNIQEGQGSEKEETKTQNIQHDSMQNWYGYWTHQEANGQGWEREKTSQHVHADIIVCQSYDQEHKKEENIIQKKFMSSYYGI